MGELHLASAWHQTELRMYSAECSVILYSVIVGTQILFEIFARHRNQTCVFASWRQDVTLPINTTSN